MARPSVLHQGFFVPNAQDVANPGLAEPDRIDFNTVAHTRWGVLSGCLVTVSGATATNTPGTALVNGVLVTVAGGQNVSVGAGGSQDRYDIVGVNDSGTLVGIAGTASLDPVFPDVPLNITTLAAVLCTAGGGNYTDNVIDKRKILADSLLTKIPPTQDLLVNRNGTGNLYGVGGDGKTVWNGDTTLQRDSPGVLRVITDLKIDNTLVAGGAITGQKLTVTGDVLSLNLRNSSTMPSTASGTPGDLFQNATTGRLYVFQSGQWLEVATLQSATPVGTVITSLQSPAAMTPLGWIEMNGGVIPETDAPALFTLPALQNRISGSGPRVLTLPDARRRVLIYNPDEAGGIGGQTSFTLLESNLPAHRHSVTISPGGGYSPSVRVSSAPAHRHAVTGGAHGHTDVPDPGHAHHGADNPLGGGFIVAQLNGQNKIDALFNDRSHTYSVEMTEWTRTAKTGITSIGSAGSTHQHEVSDAGAHDHQITVDAITAHPHNVSELVVGSSAPVTFAPAYLAVYCYIKS